MPPIQASNSNARINAGTSFFRTVSALVYTIIADRWKDDPDGTSPNAAVNFVVEQHGRMTDFLRFPLLMVTLLFDWSTLPRHRTRFHKLDHATRLTHVTIWQKGIFSFQRDLIRVYESLAVFAQESIIAKPQAATEGKIASVTSSAPTSHKCEIAIIGSGPGGAVTACELAEAGRDVLLIEEGDFLQMESCQAFSLDEMVQKYRNGGLTTSLGKPKIAYVEGRCVGGGSEINSGLYHRTPDAVLERWQRDFRVEHLSPEDLLPHFEECEKAMSVSKLPGPAPAVSRKLQEGADKLNWQCLEVPRFFTFDGRTDNQGIPTGKRNSMTRTMIPRALNAGCRLLSGTRVRNIRRAGENWTITATNAAGKRIEVEAKYIFVSCGAIHTPALLQRSGFSGHAGRALQMHPTVKLIADFNDVVGSEIPGVGVHQVKQFAPKFSFGCSISSRPYLGLGLIDYHQTHEQLRQRWLNMAIYYAMITSIGTGSVRSLPGFDDPLVSYKLVDEDMRVLSESLRKLGQLLFEAGATSLYPSIAGSPIIRSPGELQNLPQLLPRGSTSLMTIHLFSSCPMGQNMSRCVADSFGKVHRADNLYIADASLLCTAPSVNPQGSIMAIAHRNAMRFLKRL